MKFVSEPQCGICGDFDQVFRIENDKTQELGKLFLEEERGWTLSYNEGKNFELLDAVTKKEALNEAENILNSFLQQKENILER